MTTRRRLADRRLVGTFEMEVGGQHYTCTVGRFIDNSIGKLFLNSSKSNSAADTNARAGAITFSIVVQHGVDPELACGRWCAMSVIAFPASRKMACALARWLRTSGFYLLPLRTWNCVADLVEHLAEFEPTSSQLIFLWDAHQIFLELSRARQ